jgi:phage-related protein
MERTMPNTLEELRALERAVEREWWWLNGALNAVAQVQADRHRGSWEGFRQMQAQVREVDRRRVQIAVQIAELKAKS